MAKKEKTAEELYKSNQKKAKILKKVAPFVFWGFIIIAIVCFVLAIHNSLGNINEITQLLNSRKYTGEQLRTNYEFLIQKYGEWTIGNGGAGFQVKFVNIGRAAFSGIMVANFILSGVSILLAYLLGKWILPKTAQYLEQQNVDMVNLTILKEKDNKGE